jgi:hypothetical protein
MLLSLGRKHNTAKMLWGGIGWNPKSKLVFVEEKLDTVRYVHMLDVNRVITQTDRDEGDVCIDRPGWFRVISIGPKYTME